MRALGGILLGSAAGLMAMSAAQAADFPVKARKAAVQYVKICSLYGDGFYYVPGTDICLKFGGIVRSQIYYNAGGPSPTVGPASGIQGTHTRTSGDAWDQRVRAWWSVDTRQSTAYGVLRTYTIIGVSADNAGQTPVAGVYANRAFIQLAGFTFGRAQSFYDMYPSAAFTFFANRWTSDTGDSGQFLTAYTATFGGGLSATFSLEDPRRAAVGNPAALAIGTAPALNRGGISYPDVVGNLRGDWAWGSWQVMGALHNVRPGYYGATEATGNPSDVMGYAIGTGARIKVPTGVNDLFAFQFNYTHGAVRYASLLNGGFGNVDLYSGNGVALGWVADGLYGPAGTSVDLTTQWGINVGFDHGWSPSLRTSIYGTYEKVDMPNQRFACAGGTIAVPIAGGTCDPDFSMWLVGSRTQWMPVKGLIIGVDVMYERFQTAFAGGVTTAASGARVAGYNVSDEGVWEGTLRIQRNILP